MEKLIEDYQIVPVHGGGICLQGVFNGVPWTTTPVLQGKVDDKGRKLLRTKSGTIYVLGEQHASLWEIGLQIKRPENFANLRAMGIL